MHLITCMIQASSDQATERQVVLAAERRLFLKRRWRGVAEDGTEFGFDLETRLSDGGVIFHDDGKDYIVRQLPELVFEVPFASPDHGALLGWKVGNLHLPAQVQPHALWVLHDEAMRQLLEREGWEYSERTVVFTPMKSMAHAI